MNNEAGEVKNSLTKKLSVSFFAILIIIGLAVSSLSYFYTKRYIWKVFSKIAVSCALDTANMLYDAPIDKFLKGEEQKLYQNYLKSIKNIAQTFGLKYLYVYVPDTQNDKLIAIYGVEGKTSNLIKDFSLGNSSNGLKLNPKVMNMFYHKDKKLILEMDNKYGHVITGYSTILNANNEPIGVVGADIDFGYVQHRLIKDIAKVFAIIFLTFFVIYLFLITYIKKTFIKPILLISNNMRNFVKNYSLKFKPIELNTNDEFNIMANSYNLMAKSIQASIKGIFDSQMETIYSLAKIVQTRDDNTGKHIERVAEYCKILTIAVKVFNLYPDIVDKNFIKYVVNASPLHDIGKVAITDLVLLKDRQLSDEDIANMQKHTIYGEETLAKINSRFGNNDFIKIGMLIARSHHEKWDGTGYPDGLKGEEIPLAARIAAIADVYDALASKRVYKDAFPHSKCVQIILEGKGTHFDPQLVDLFMKIEHKFLKKRQAFEAQEIRSFFNEADKIL